MRKPMKNLLLDYLDRHASLLLLEIAADGTIRGANNYARQLLGDGLKGKRLGDVFLDFREDLDLARLVEERRKPHLINVATAHGLPQTFHFRFYPLENHVVAIGEMNSIEVENLRRELVQVNNELNNLTRRLHKKNAELTRLNELKNDFLGMAAHDLRNPLSAIIGYGEFLLMEAGKLSRPEHAELLKDICSLSRFMLAIINDLLDVTAIEMGKLVLKLRPDDFSALLRKTVKMNRIFAEKKGIALVLEDRLPPEKVCFDAGRVNQVLNNLISNAIKFSGAGTRVTVTAAVDRERLIVSVHDQGPGIPAEEMSQLFVPFPKISVKASEKEKGTGLGLAISQKIIAAHKGRIWAESEKGKGSTFFFSLPLQT